MLFFLVLVWIEASLGAFARRQLHDSFRRRIEIPANRARRLGSHLLRFDVQDIQLHGLFAQPLLKYLARCYLRLLLLAGVVFAETDGRFVAFKRNDLLDGRPASLVVASRFDVLQAFSYTI